MTRGQGDNGEPRFSLEMTLDDLPMMVDLMMYGSTRAMLSGGQGNPASARFDRLREQVRAMSPIPQRYSKTGYAWADACLAARSADQVWLTKEAKGSFARGLESVAVDVHADERTFRIAEDFKSMEEADALVRRVEGLMEPLVRMGGEMLVLTVGEVEVPAGSRYPYEPDEKFAVLREALEEAFGDEADRIRVSWAGHASGHRVAAVFNVPVGMESEFAAFLEGGPAAPRP